jgi:hypothetical protein
MSNSVQQRGYGIPVPTQIVAAPLYEAILVVFRASYPQTKVRLFCPTCSIQNLDGHH